MDEFGQDAEVTPLLFSKDILKAYYNDLHLTKNNGQIYKC